MEVPASFNQCYYQKLQKHVVRTGLAVKQDVQQMFGNPAIGINIGKIHFPTRFQKALGLAKDACLVSDQIDDAIRYDDIKAIGFQNTGFGFELLGSGCRGAICSVFMYEFLICFGVFLMSCYTWCIALGICTGVQIVHIHICLVLLVCSRVSMLHE